MTISATPAWAADLVDLLERQRDIYRRLHELTDQQARLVEASDAEPLLALLAKRQLEIDQLSQLNGRLEPYKQNWPTLWAQLDAHLRARVQRLIDQVQELLEGIIRRDERDRAALAEHRDRSAAELQRASTGSAMHRAYHAATDERPRTRYTDQQG